MRKATERFVAWCADDSAAARFERSIVQGAIAVIAVGVTTGEWGAAAATGAIMAVISPIQKALGNRGEVE